MQEANVDLLIKTANEIVKLNPRAIVAFICVNNEARAVVRAGEEAIKAGVNASEIARKIGSALGGGGSGKPDFAQAGGLRVENAAKALVEAKEFIYRIVGK
jgi:alanyl-tRNA synthetase